MMKSLLWRIPFNTNDQLLNAFFRVGLLPYLRVVTTSFEWGTLIQHLESIMICEESSTNANDNQIMLDVLPNDEREKEEDGETWSKCK
jgi:hypothetical protein